MADGVQRQGVGFSRQGEQPQLNPEIRPQLTLEDCIMNDEMELLASYVFGTQLYPGKFHKINTGETVAYPVWDRLMLAIQQFEAAGFTFGGVISKPATMWKVEPFAMVQEADRDRVAEIMKDLVGWRTDKLEKYFKKWEPHLAKIEFDLDERGVKAPISIEAGRTLNIRSLVTMEKGEEPPVGAPNKAKETAPVLTRLQQTQGKTLKALDNDKLLAKTAASGSKGVAGAVAELNAKDKTKGKGKAGPEPEVEEEPVGEAEE